MTASDLVRLLAETNLAIVAGVIVVLLARKAVRRLFGASAAYGLWLLPALAAVAVSLPTRTVEMAGPVAGVSPSPVSALAELPAAALDGHGLAAGPDLATVAVWAWIAGVAAMGLWLVVHQLRFMREVARGRAGPAVVGFVRPRIVMPADFETRFTRREQLVVLAHERTHLLRGDAQVNGVVALVRCLCWFNPLAHLGAHLMRVDQELACDAGVIARYPTSRAPYAKALLKTELAARPLPLGCYWPARAVHPLTERMAMLQREPVRRARRLAGAAGVGVLAAATGVAAWAAKPPVVLAVQVAARPAALPEPAAARAPARIDPGSTSVPGARALDALRPETRAPVADQPDAPAAPDAVLVAKVDAPLSERTIAAAAAPTQAIVPTLLSPAVVEARERVPPSTADLPPWSQTPSAAEMQAAYPSAAAKANFAASGTLECSVDTEGALVDCVVVSESAPGFGAAALAVAPKFRLPTTSPSGASMVGRTVRPRIGWVNPAQHTEWTNIEGDPGGAVAFNCRVRAHGRLDNCVLIDARPRSRIALDAAAQAAGRFRAARFTEFSRIRLVVAVVAGRVPPDPPTSWNAQPQGAPT